MLTTLDLLKDFNPYPVPTAVINEMALTRGLDLDGDVTAATLLTAEYNLVKADIMLWLSLAPAVSQGGQSYSFSEEQRCGLRLAAEAIYGKYDTATDKPRPQYGYKGSRL